MPLFPFSPPSVAGAGDLPVRTTDDVVTLLPRAYQDPAVAPVRDALVTALTQIVLDWQAEAGYAAAQSDITRATDQFLSGQAADRGIFQSASENQELFRARVLGVPALVSRAAIVSAVNAILANYTTVQCRVFDSIHDRAYVFNGTGGRCYIGAGPRYVDRLYPEYASLNNGVSLPCSSPGGAWVFLDNIGRYFVVRIPDLSPIDAEHAAVFNGDPEVNNDFRFYAFTATAANNNWRGYVTRDLQSTIDVYRAIVNTVQSICGHSVRWQLFVDPKLTS